MHMLSVDKGCLLTSVLTIRELYLIKSQIEISTSKSGFGLGCAFSVTLIRVWFDVSWGASTLIQWDWRGVIQQVRQEVSLQGAGYVKMHCVYWSDSEEWNFPVHLLCGSVIERQDQNPLGHKTRELKQQKNRLILPNLLSSKYTNKNIAIGTTDPWYWLYNLSYLFISSSARVTSIKFAKRCLTQFQISGPIDQ